MNSTRTARAGAVALLAAVGLVAAGCSPFSGGGNADGTVELTLLTLDGGDDNKALEEIIDAFEAENPGITINATWVPEDTYPTKLKTLLLADPPDIAWPYGWDQALAFTPLNDLLFEEYDLDLADYNSIVSTSCVWEDTIFCFGTTVGSMVTFYNKALFDEKGVPYPDNTTPLTFAELAEVAAQVTTPGATPEETVFGLSPAILPAYIDPANVLDESGRTVQVTTPEFEGTVDILAGMVADGVAPPPEVIETLGGGTAEALFIDGHAAMMIGDSFTIDSLEQAGIEYGIAPTPIVDGFDPWIVAWTNPFGIPRGAEHAEEAAAFLAFLAGEGQDIQATYGIMPTSNAAASTWATTPGREELVAVNGLIRPSVFNPNQWAWNAPIIDAINGALVGGDTVALLADAEPKAQQGNDTTWEQFDLALAAAGLK